MITKLKNCLRWLFPRPISIADTVRNDSRTEPFLRQRDFIRKRNKYLLLLTLILSIPLSWYLYTSGFVTKDGFSTIVAAIIGGFVGSSISYIIQGK